MKSEIKLARELALAAIDSDTRADFTAAFTTYVRVLGLSNEEVAERHLLTLGAVQRYKDGTSCPPPVVGRYYVLNQILKELEENETN